MDFYESDDTKKLFICGLNYYSTNETIKTYFEQWGNVVDVHVVKDPITERSRGFGFIIYTESYMVDQAMVNRPHEIDGRIVNTNHYIPHNLRNSEHHKKLFIRGLSYYSTNETVKTYFKQWGTIVDVTVVKDPTTERSRGFGFVTYTEPYMVDQVMVNRSHEIDGRIVNINRYIPRNFRESDHYKKLFICGLSYYSTNETVKTHFEQWGNIADVTIVKDNITERSRGFGFVTYTESYMIHRAMVNRPHKIDGRIVEIKHFIPHHLRSIHTQDIAVPVTNTFVYGITEHTENDLREYFEQFGKIVNITIVTNKYTGQRKGYGFIEYENTDSAKKVILMRFHDVAGVKLYLRKAFYRHAGCRRRRNRRIHDNQDIQYIRDIKYIGLNRKGRKNRYRNSRRNHNHGYQNNVSTDGYSLNSGEACQGSEDNIILQNCAISYPTWHSVGNGWGHIQQTGEKCCPNQLYVFDGQMNPYNNVYTPYVYPVISENGDYDENYSQY